jgi:hypothetical protein
MLKTLYSYGKAALTITLVSEEPLLFNKIASIPEYNP